MKKILLALLLVALPAPAFAAPVSWDYTTNLLQPLRSGWNALVKAPRFQATSTTASIFPYASTTVVSADKFCLTGNLPCVAAWPGNISGYPFPSNATSTQIAFNGGLLAYASSTIGSGAQATGLTISGGATTTGTSYFAGRVGVASSTPDSGFSVNSFTGRALLHVGDDVTNNSMTKLLIENRWADNGSKSILVQRNSTTPHFMVGGGGFSAFGTSTPYARLTVWGSGSTGSSQNVEFVNSASTTLASILNDGTAYFKGSVGIGTTSPFSILHVTSGASATTTVTIGSIGLTSSKGCVNMNRSDGGPGSFYINAAGIMVTEANYCK